MLTRAPVCRRLALCAALLLPLAAGCHLLQTRGSGTHMDASPDHPHDTNPTRRYEMVVQVTTDREGNVADIQFQRSSGKPGVDGLVAESIRQGWPRQPSTRSVASLTYSVQDGFSTPKLLANTPVP